MKHDNCKKKLERFQEKNKVFDCIADKCDDTMTNKFDSVVECEKTEDTC